MAAMNINAPICDRAETVRVGVVLATNPTEEKFTDSVVISDGGRGIDYKSAKSEDTKSFTFDQVVTSDNIESLQSELLQPLAESLRSGYNGALLICGASTETTRPLTDHSIVRQTLTNVFSYITSRMAADVFISVSFVQFYPDGSAADLLSVNKQALQPVTHPVLGSLVKGLCEVGVCSAEEACTLYETCSHTMKTTGGSISSRCSCLFSVSVEWKLNPEQVESDVCRSRLQLFSLAGGASRTDLRGVSPLVKVLDQMRNSATVSNNLLSFLLKDALTGNNRTSLIYCINPQGLLDDETHSALDLAQKLRGLVTKPTISRWSPKATEREIRDEIMDLQNGIMSQGESGVNNIYKLAELTQNLQIVKNQSWEKRMEESERIKVQHEHSKSSKSNEQFFRGHHTDHRETTDTTKCLQDQLREELEEHIKEGRGSVEGVQERVARIQQLREVLRDETLKSGAFPGQFQLRQQSQLEHNEAQQRRRQLKEDHGRLIQEEVAKMERDLAQEQLLAAGPQRELLVLSRERRVLVLQMEALRAEAQQAERDLQDQHHRHQTELCCLRDESLQVFRAFRQVCEEQRKTSESRYRSVLLEAVQDAIYLSAQNQQLQADNKQLRKALEQIKDTLTVRGDPMADLITQQQ